MTDGPLVRDRSRAARRPPKRPIGVVIGIVALVAGVLAAVLVVAFVVLAPQPEPSAPLADGTAVPAPTLSPSPPPPFDKAAYSLDDPTSLWVVINKLRGTNPADYEPPDLVTVPITYANYNNQLRAEAAGALGTMEAAFFAETGAHFQAQSAYRSYGEQSGIYDGWVASLGQEAADLTSARPGHSEHQTGWAVDINSIPSSGCNLEPCFADTPTAQWLKANSWKYGFIVRYPDGKTPITGYEYEPYHMRYVGVDLATEMHDTGVETLEEFFGLPAAPDYAD
ncbi:MAG: M15 family metallopeptidase [Actinomycetales bacterium]|nr:M15 family metallopeptidase [Actinomycetales bacterium]